MLDLDFAFFNMMTTNKQGLVYRKFFLDRLAPVLFSPRLEKLINFNGLGLQGGNIFLPLGQGNWDLLAPGMKRLILEKSITILEQYQIPALAVDRRLKNEFFSLFNNFPLVFGDNFIKALASVLVKEFISRRAVKKIIVAGEIPEMPGLLEDFRQYGIPVSIQNNHPSAYEIMAYHLLYEKGVAVSTSYINPMEWEKGDLVVLFEAEGLALTSPPSFILDLTYDGNHLAPELANTLKLREMDTSMNTMAPILESCLWAKAGFTDTIEEQNNAVAALAGPKNMWVEFNQIGEDIGLWDFFLDKDI
ncbi:MAG: hypothetical protein ABFC94_12610 [Syntrophomonas sp.]